MNFYHAYFKSIIAMRHNNSSCFLRALVWEKAKQFSQEPLNNQLLISYYSVINQLLLNLTQSYSSTLYSKFKFI